MSTAIFQPKSESPQEVIRMLQRELAETNREVMALTLELEQRVDVRTAELEAAQQALRQKNVRLETANKELEAFSYSVSHDLRAPLRHLQGYAEALIQDCQGSLDEAGKGYVTNIINAVEQMNSLIEALLRFARTTQQPLRQMEIDLNELVRQVIADMAQETAARNIQWTIEPLPVVRGDLQLLRQVWINLISNAVKYTRHKNPAHIEIGSRTDSEDEWSLFVRDNGAGFDMAQAQNLFGLFQRFHHRHDFEGTGLGLAIVRRIVDRHAGRTWAESQPGKGATFYFTLPYAECRR